MTKLFVFTLQLKPLSFTQNPIKALFQTGIFKLRADGFSVGKDCLLFFPEVWVSEQADNLFKKLLNAFPTGAALRQGQPHGSEFWAAAYEKLQLFRKLCRLKVLTWGEKHDMYLSLIHISSAPFALRGKRDSADRLKRFIFFKIFS